MKKWTLFLGLYFCVCLLAACGATGNGEDLAGTPDGEPDQSAGAVSLEHSEEPVWLTCRIVDGAEDGTLLLAELDEALSGGHDGLHGGRSVYRLTVTEDMAVTLDGAAASAADLRDGMPVEIAFDGAIEDSFPGQLGRVWSINAYSIGSPQSPGGGYYDLCGLYLQVLEDLWEVDAGLNGGAEVIGLDLSQVPGDLTDSEKAAIAWRFGELHGVETVAGTDDQLVEQGYITGEPLEETDAQFWHWEDGVLFSITPNDGHEGEAYSLPILFFNAEKWRSSLGAYFFFDCSCLWPEGGTWSGYQVGSEMIS